MTLSVPILIMRACSVNVQVFAQRRHELKDQAAGSALDLTQGRRLRSMGHGSESGSQGPGSPGFVITGTKAGVDHAKAS